MKSMYLSELQQEFAALGQPKFRAGQVFDWIHAKQVTEFTMMTNLPKALREELAASYAIPSVTVEDRLISQIDGTEKYLLALPDGNAVEAVREGRVLLLSRELFDAPYLQTAAALMLAKAAYPSLFRDVQPGEALRMLAEEAAGTAPEGVFYYLYPED